MIIAQVYRRGSAWLEHPSRFWNHQFASMIHWMAFKGFQIFIVTLDIALRQKSMRHLFFIGIFYLCLGILAIIGLMRTNLRTRANLLSPWILLNISDISILIICIYIQKDIVGLVSWLCLLGINIIYGIIKPLQLLMQQ